MRRALTFLCEGATCVGTLDDASGTTGLLIVSGGNEIRCGAHRGMAQLAQDIASAGYPVFRYDRRGIGDSEGNNGGFASSAPDIVAAVKAFCTAAPHLTRIVAFGNCDAATALVLHRGDAAIGALVLANPWVFEPKDDLPPPAAIKDRYVRRLRDPEAWKALISGKVNIAAVARGLGRIAMPGKPADLASNFAAALIHAPLPTRILLAARDGTALAFADAWQGPDFAAARARADIVVETIDSASHSFSSQADYGALQAALITALGSGGGT